MRIHFKFRLPSSEFAQNFFITGQTSKRQNLGKTFFNLIHGQCCQIWGNFQVFGNILGKFCSLNLATLSMDVLVNPDRSQTNEPYV